jgi:hypothetical protein
MTQSNGHKDVVAEQIEVAEAPQPQERFIIEALMQENASLNNNRLYLIATVKQMTATLHAERVQWSLEKASLMKSAE